MREEQRRSMPWTVATVFLSCPGESTSRRDVEHGVGTLGWVGLGGGGWGGDVNVQPLSCTSFGTSDCCSWNESVAGALEM